MTHSLSNAFWSHISNQIFQNPRYTIFDIQFDISFYLRSEIWSNIQFDTWIGIRSKIQHNIQSDICSNIRFNLSARSLTVVRVLPSASMSWFFGLFDAFEAVNLYEADCMGGGAQGGDCRRASPDTGIGKSHIRKEIKIITWPYYHHRPIMTRSSSGFIQWPPTDTVKTICWGRRGLSEEQRLASPSPESYCSMSSAGNCGPVLMPYWSAATMATS